LSNDARLSGLRVKIQIFKHYPRSINIRGSIIFFIFELSVPYNSVLVKQIEDLSKNRVKEIRSLQQKKSREINQLFVIEGKKIVQEYIAAASGNFCTIRYIVATTDWIKQNYSVFAHTDLKIYRADYADIKRISNLLTPQGVLAAVEFQRAVYQPGILLDNVTLAFSSIRDPGNFGTIIRTADWFGFKNIICSPDSVDHYNPKVLQSAMGSSLRVNVFYLELAHLIKDVKENNIPLYGTSVSGRNFYSEDFPDAFVLLFGNEASGIDSELLRITDKNISIPRYAEGNDRAESLNLASSVAIITSEIRRRKKVNHSK